MPLYDYQCPGNGVQIEIHHPMALTIKTWGELCKQSGHALGDTAADTPVEKMMGAGNPFKPTTAPDFKKDRAPFRGTMMAPMRNNKF
jgi:hypothetical protein